MKRKIVQHGSSSLTVTLPFGWVKKFDLKKGDQVNVEENGGKLVLSTEKEHSVNKKEVTTTESGIFTKNNLSHLYQLGYDEIEINFEDSETLKEIQQRLSNCIGFEIIDQKPNRVYIKSIATTLDSEFDTLLRKAFMITNEMARGILEALERKEYARLKELRNMEVLNNKFTDVCIRILNKKGYKIPNRTMQMYEIIKNVERLGDEFKHICDLFENRDKIIYKELVKYFKETMEYYLAFYNIFYKFDPVLKKKIYLERKSLLQKYNNALEKLKGMEARFMHHLINIVEKSYEGTGGYFALIL